MLLVFPGNPNYDPAYDPKGVGHYIEFETCKAFRGDGKVCEDVGYRVICGEMKCRAHFALDDKAMKDYLVEAVN